MAMGMTTEATAMRQMWKFSWDAAVLASTVAR